MRAYATADWLGFLTAEVGAAAGLTGLLFVAVSINLDRILSFSKLPARAAETLVVLLLVLVVATLGLVPQSIRALGVEVAVLGGATWLVTLLIQLRHGPDSAADPWYWFASRVATTQLPTLPFLIAGVSLIAGRGGGLYWFVPATLFAFVGAVYNAWVLLVEIVRQRPSLSKAEVQS